MIPGCSGGDKTGHKSRALRVQNAADNLTHLVGVIGFVYYAAETVLFVKVVMMVMSQKAVDSLLASSFKLGGDASIALGPVGEGAKSNITADFISFAKTKGLYAGLNLEGSIVKVRDSLNTAYYGKDVRPIDIIVKNEVNNEGSRDLLVTLKKVSAACSS